MSIELIWDTTLPHIVHYRFQRGWTWEDFRQTALKEHTWGEALDGVRYDVIGDLTHASIPQGTGFSNVVRLFDKGPQNRKTIVIVGSSLANSMVSIAGRIYPHIRNHFYTAPNIEEARKMILSFRLPSASG